jgi:hypothetical protein
VLEERDDDDKDIDVDELVCGGRCRGRSEEDSIRKRDL